MYDKAWQLHCKSDVVRVYFSREMGERRLISCEGCIRIEENNLGCYVTNSVELLIEGVERKLQKQ